MKTISTKNNGRHLSKWVDRFSKVPILVVGDLMVDRSIQGTVERISPEAPVPVIDVKSDIQTPGGAGNVASNLAALGASPTILSVRGDDSAGERLQMDLENRNIDVSGLLIDPERPTITKTRLIAGHQQVARFDVEKRGGISTSIHNQINARLAEILPRHRCVIISDYGKCVVTSGVIQTALRLAHRHGISVMVDPKIEHYLRYKGVDCITPNTKEATEGMRVLPPKNEEELIQLGWKTMKKLRCESLLITRGEKGMILFHKNGRIRKISALAQEVYDVTGAGDTVISTFSLARAVGAPHEPAAEIANAAASIVVGKVGTAVVTREELLARLETC